MRFSAQIKGLSLVGMNRSETILGAPRKGLSQKSVIAPIVVTHYVPFLSETRH